MIGISTQASCEMSRPSGNDRSPSVWRGGPDHGNRLVACSRGADARARLDSALALLVAMRQDWELKETAWLRRRKLLKPSQSASRGRGAELIYGHTLSECRFSSIVEDLSYRLPQEQPTRRVVTSRRRPAWNFGMPSLLSAGRKLCQ